MGAHAIRDQPNRLTITIKHLQKAMPLQSKGMPQEEKMMKIFSVISTLGALILGLDALILKGDSKMIQRLGISDEKQRDKLAKISSILCFLVACTYPYQELIGWPPLLFGHDWVNDKSQSVLLTILILIIMICIQKVFQKRDRQQQNRQ